MLYPGLGDNVDDPRKGIGTIERRTGAANDLNAGDMLYRIAAPEIALIAMEQGGDRYAILQHQYLGSELAENTADNV